MAKKTKFNNDVIKTDTIIADNKVAPVTPEVPPDKHLTTANGNTNVISEASPVTSKVISDELEQFEILKYNIVTSDNYVKFIELAKTKYNMVDLLKLNKTDLVCIIGNIIDKLYNKENELSKLAAEYKLKTQPQEMSISKTTDYSDLMRDLGKYKSW